MKKMKTWIAALMVVCSLSFGASAQEPTIVEKHWNDFQKTIEVKQVQGEGKIDVDALFLDETDYYQLMYGTNLEYGLRDNVQMNLAVYRSNYTDTDFTLYEDNLVEYYGALQAKLYEQDGLTVHGKGELEAYYEKYKDIFNQTRYAQDLNTNFGLAVDKVLGDGLVVHHTSDLIIDKDGEEWETATAFSNGAEYQINGQNALKGYLYTTVAGGDLSNTLNLLYKNTNSNQVTFMTHLNKRLGAKNWRFTNQIEVKPRADLAVTGEYIFNTDTSDIVALNLQTEKGKVFAKVGAAMNIGTNLKRYSLVGSAKYQLTDQMDLTAGIAQTIKLYGSEYAEKETDLQVGVSYEL